MSVLFHADLHIHSKYSRACSKDCDLEHLAWWARRKGVRVVGTGDFTHPAWFEHLRDSLVPAEPGLFRLRDDIDKEVSRRLPSVCHAPVRFMLSVEISTIYSRAERTRKVHHLIYVPDFNAAEAVTDKLARIGNLASDGRPILGLDSRDLLEITLESDPGSYLVPAHVWTPWFSSLGSKSGFDRIDDCYADLADHVFALETGLSSDPPMNWRVSALDRYRLVSNSDAHSPPMLAREASVFDTGLDYFAMRRALETGRDYLGTVEFFPEEGKYHLDGHRKCDVRLDPAETREHAGRCPVCGKPLTVGVLHRVEELADRPGGTRPDDASGFRNLVPLPEIVGEIRGVGAKSKTVAGEVASLVSRLGPELTILTDSPLDEVARAGSSLLAEAIGRLRRGEVVREAGYDGEYGVIRLFRPGEVGRRSRDEAALFDLDEAAATGKTGNKTGKGPRRTPRPETGHRGAADTAGEGGPASRPKCAGRPGAAAARDEDTPPTGVGPGSPAPTGSAPGSGALLDGLDPDQRAAASTPGGPLLVIAGPGTGKTRTLTHRIAHLVTERGVPPERCLAITFTRRACEEMRERLAALVPEQAPRITVTTFHGLGAMILRERHERLGLSAAFRIADESERLAVAVELAGSEREGRRLLSELSRDAELRAWYEKALRERDLVDFDDLVALPVALLSAEPDVAEHYRQRYTWISVDEYQDVDERQYQLLRLLTRPDGCLTAIGDPDQSIYRFRGADVGFFLRFGEDFPGATTVQLTRNYRSSATIVAAALQAIAPATLVPGRLLRAVREEAAPAPVGVYGARDTEDEASFIARTIDRLLGGSSFHSLDSGRVDSRARAGGLSFADIAVLYRTDAQAKPVMEALTRSGVPFQKRSHDRLADRPGVADVVRELRHLGSGSLVVRLREAARKAVEPLPEAVARERAVEADSAVDLLAPLARRCEHDLERFLTELALGAEVDTWDPRADRVTLLTLHAAKGLEFPVVFIVGCEDGLLPLRWPDDPDGTDVDEERRLFFVGVTRAQAHLFLSRAGQRTRYGRTLEPVPSPFLQRLDDALLERLDEGAGGRRRSRGRQLRLL